MPECPPALPLRKRQTTAIQYLEPGLDLTNDGLVPKIYHCPMFLPRQADSVALNGHIIFYILNGKLHAVDVFTGIDTTLITLSYAKHIVANQINGVVVETSDKIVIVDRYSSVSRSEGVHGESTDKHEVRGGCITISDISHELSRIHGISAVTCTRIAGSVYYWIGWTNSMISVYGMEEDGRSRLDELTSWMVDSTPKYFSSCPESNRIACLLESGQIVLFDSFLLDFLAEREMQRIRGEHSEKHDAKISIASWNVDSSKPPVSRAFWEEWLGLETDPDIIAVGLQEVVDLESTEQLRSNAERTYQWQQAIEGVCKNYVVLEPISLIGLLLFVLHKPHTKLRHSSNTYLKTGLKGRHGNKGAVAWRAFLEDSSICIVNCHLTAGQDSLMERNSDAALIMKTCKFPKIYSNDDKKGYESIPDHDYVFFFGDLNYRVDMERESVMNLIRQRSYADILKNDQLTAQRQLHTGFVLSNLKEGPISHPPSYKYDPGTDLYDTSDKQRTPSYCDRILFQTNNNLDITLHAYSMIRNVTSSDHRPIFARFVVKTLRTNQLKVQKGKHMYIAALIDRITRSANRCCNN